MMLKSRKFLVWFTWVCLVAASIVITKTIEPSMVEWFGIVSAMYIGGNTATKFIQGKANG